MRAPGRAPARAQASVRLNHPWHLNRSWSGLRPCKRSRLTECEGHDTSIARQMAQHLLRFNACRRDPERLPLPGDLEKLGDLPEPNRPRHDRCNRHDRRRKTGSFLTTAVF